jgi:hypothetical protein
VIGSDRGQAVRVRDDLVRPGRRCDEVLEARAVVQGQIPGCVGAVIRDQLAERVTGCADRSYCVPAQWRLKIGHACFCC